MRIFTDVNKKTIQIFALTIFNKRALRALSLKNFIYKFYHYFSSFYMRFKRKSNLGTIFYRIALLNLIHIILIKIGLFVHIYPF